MKWKNGRQRGTNYKKLTLFYFRIWKFGFDVYILKYEKDTVLDWHKDPVKDGKHYRLNVKLSGDSCFYVRHNEVIDWIPDKVIFFRPDILEHKLDVITQTFKLSIGFVKYEK